VTATPLYFVRFKIDRAKFIAFASERGTIPNSGDLGYALHQVLTETFGPGAPKPFHLFDAPAWQAVAYSSHDKAGLQNLAHQQREAGGPGWLSASEALGLAVMTAEAVPPSFAEGERLRFSVRTRPVCRISRHKERGLPREYDVLLRAVALKTDEAGWIDREEVYKAWLREQIPPEAAKVPFVQLSGFRRTQVFRKGAPRLDGPDVSFSGVLEVANSVAFIEFLKRGAGRHRAFGFGMMLLGGDALMGANLDSLTSRGLQE